MAKEKAANGPAWPKHVGAMWPLAKIKPYPKNPRAHPNDQIEILANLIKKYGPDQPIVVDEKGVILKGHGRLLAAKKAGIKDFPVVQHMGLSDDDKRAIRIADNQVALLSDWLPQQLKLEVAELKLNNFDLQMLGFDEATLNQMQHSLGDFADQGINGQDRGNLLELVNITIDDPKHIVESGDHYVLAKRHHLLCDSVIADWPKWKGLLEDDALFCPYPGVFVPFSTKAAKHNLIMVQPDPYIAGHILDRFVEVNGKKAVQKVSQ